LSASFITNAFNSFCKLQCLFCHHLAYGQHSVYSALSGLFSAFQVGTLQLLHTVQVWYVFSLAANHSDAVW